MLKVMAFLVKKQGLDTRTRTRSYVVEEHVTEDHSH
jgi:hypothetical protein